MTERVLARQIAERECPYTSQTDVAPLNEDQRRLPLERFGGKASGLKQLKDAGLRIAPGYALSRTWTRRMCNGHLRLGDLRRLHDLFEELVTASPVNAVIVRSSHPREGSDARLAGLLLSKRDICTFRDVARAIGDVAVSACAYGAKHIAVVVQSQVDCEFSAIVATGENGPRIELFSGDLSDPIAGKARPSVVLVGPPEKLMEQRLPHLRLVADGANLGEQAVPLAADALAAVIAYQGKGTLFELGRSKSEWIVFQVEALTEARYASIAVEEEPLPPPYLQEVDQLGRKAAAMLFFRDLGLFSKQMRLFPSNCMPEASDVAALRASPGPFTVRFSDGSALGLPRIFAETADTALQSVEQRPQSWTAIVHDFIRVRRSFEVLIAPDTVHLEHLPGLWESENTMPPDGLVIHNDGDATAYAAAGPRIVTNGTQVDVSRVISTPTPRPLFSEWAQRISEVATVIRSNLLNFPVNLHFVEDEDGEWHFLNIRAGFTPEPTRVNAPYMFSVSSVSDLENWDGAAPILVSATTERGRESGLVPLAEALRHLRVPIYSEFGLLSHPSMVLQAHGVRLQPAYFGGPQSNRRPCDTWRFRLDSGSDAFQRIMRENPVLDTASVRLVKDRNPLVPGHHIAVAKSEIPSFADIDQPELALEQVLSSLSQHLNVSRGNALIYERGRASFCTSGFTHKTAHFHLLPADAFVPDILVRFAEATGAKAYESVSAAWAAAKNALGEFILAGRADGNCYLLTFDRRRPPKRFMRTFLGKHLRG